MRPLRIVAKLQSTEAKYKSREDYQLADGSKHTAVYHTKRRDEEAADYQADAYAKANKKSYGADTALFILLEVAHGL
ncbi:MAG: hypothetical protein IKO85_08015 [Bacteroidaceae bacterium]|nr:hypothetical protein [Bacteroidaceae bacterium]